MAKTKSFSICLEEHSTILNTLCHECLSKYLREWMKHRPKKTKDIVNKELENLSNIGKVKGQECLVCNKNQIICCPYCFIETIFEKLRNNSQDELANSLIRLI